MGDLLAGARNERGSQKILRSKSHSENSDSRSIRQRVFSELYKNLLLTAKPYVNCLFSVIETMEGTSQICEFSGNITMK